MPKTKKIQNNKTVKPIRNFSIIAHIDHGKTTLTDQLLKLTSTIPAHLESQRILDTNPIEKERGITIKLAPVTMRYQLPQNLKQKFQYKFCNLNLIDTPGHVDFSYEVSRSLYACEGALLLVDANQGIQAQTLAHAQEAANLGLTLLPAVNKIDLETAQIDETLSQLKQIFGYRSSEVSLISAKTGEGVEELLKRIVVEIPPPSGHEDSTPKALVFNSIYDRHLGVIAFVKVVDGEFHSDQELELVASKSQIAANQLGIFTPQRTPLEKLSAGQVGYIATGLKDIRVLKVGDTLTVRENAAKISPLPGFRFPKPVVFADIYPAQDTNINELKKAIEKHKLTDAAVYCKPTHTPSMGGGFRLGFLGLFHSQITRERLSREYGADTVMTQPTVSYTVIVKDGSKISLQHASELPDASRIEKILQPMVKATVVCPKKYLGPIIQLLEDSRGVYQNTVYFGNLAQIIYDLPLSEMIFGFTDELKSKSRGFATFDYEHIEPKPVDAVKLSILVNREEVEPLARIVVRKKAQKTGRELAKKLKELLPGQLFAVPIQAAIGNKVIARETLPAARKDVTAKLYGGDRTRKMKLLEKQKKGKKKLAKTSKAEVPEEVFTELMKL